MVIRNTVLMLLTTILLSPPIAQAETTQELISRLAKQARKNSWVQPTDCQAEQTTVRQHSSCATEDEITSILEYPWVYRFSGERSGEEMPANELLQNAEKFEKTAANQEIEKQRARAAKESPDPSVRLGAVLLSPERIECDIRISRLRACTYRTAAARKSGTPPIAPAQAQAKLDSQCAADAVANLNKALQTIDQRLATFLESPAGQQTGTTTPSLQAVMWGCREQITVMKQHCPNAEAFQERIHSRVNALASAQQACRQLQSNPEVCEPVSPEQLMAGYERAQKEAEAAASQQQQSTNLSLAQETGPAAVMAADLPLADFVGYQTGRCLESGFSPVARNGCVICGNPEGSLGAGFMWRACHRSSQGVSAVR